jgi:hypothetical protein
MEKYVRSGKLLRQQMIGLLVWGKNFEQVDMAEINKQVLDVLEFISFLDEQEIQNIKEEYGRIKPGKDGQTNT